MPLTNAVIGEKQTIKLVRCSSHQRRFLRGLGIFEGQPVTVLNKFCGSITVSTPNSQCAISSEMAGKIIF